jgi:6-phosphogluconolactonase
MMSGNINFHSFERKETLVGELSENIAKNLQEAIEKRGSATLMVSGGSTPKPLFEKLREIDIEWEKVTVGLCDERWVKSDHEDSNELFVKTYLLQDRAERAKFIGLFLESKSAKEAQRDCSLLVKERLSPFDVLILGMGSDAHTASLFPNNPKLKEGLDLDNKEYCIDIEPDTVPHKRMSLTRSAILSAEHLYLHFEGEEKLAVYKEALKIDDIYMMPIRSILDQDKRVVEVYYA